MASNSFDTTTGLLLAIEASPTGLLVSDADGTIRLVNRELERAVRLQPRARSSDNAPTC